MLSLLPKYAKWPISVNPPAAIDPALLAQFRFVNGEAINEVDETFAIVTGTPTISDKITTKATAADGMSFPTVCLVGDFTIELKVNPISMGFDGSAIAVWNGATASSALWGLTFYKSTGSNVWAFFMNNIEVVRASTSSPLNQPLHIAVTRKSGTIRIFLDGVLSGVAQYSGDNVSAPSLPPTRLTDGYTNNWIQGDRWDIRIFNECKYDANFQIPVTLGALVASEYSQDDSDAMCLVAAMRRDALVNEVDGAPILTTTTCRAANGKIVTTTSTASRFTIPLPKKFGVGNWTLDFCARLDSTPGAAGVILLGQWYDGSVVHADNRWCVHVASTRALTLRIKRSATATDVLVINGPTLALNQDYRIVAECIAGNVTLKVFDAQTGAEASSASGTFAQDMFGTGPYWASNRGDGATFAAATKIWNIVLANKALYNGVIVRKAALPKVRQTYYSTEELAKIACQFTGRNSQAREEVSGELITTSGTGTVNNQRLVTTQINTSRWYIPCQPFSAGDFTIELDLKLLGSSGASTRPIFGQFRGDVGPNSWVIYTLGTNLAFQCVGTDQTSAGIDSATGPVQYRTLSSTAEYHVVIQRINGVISMYIDGTLIGTANFNKEFADISAYPYITNLYDLATGKYTATEIRNVRIARQAMYPSGTIVKAPFKHIKVNKPSLYMGHNVLSNVMQGGAQNLNYLNQWQSAGNLSHTLFRDVRDPQNVKVVRLLCLIYERSYTVLGWRTLPNVAPTPDMPQFTNTLKIAGGSNLVLSAAPNASVDNGEGKYWSGNMFGTVAMGRHVPFEFV